MELVAEDGAVGALIQGQSSVSVVVSVVAVHARAVTLAVEHDAVLGIVVHLGGGSARSDVRRYFQ